MCLDGIRKLTDIIRYVTILHKEVLPDSVYYESFMGICECSQKEILSIDVSFSGLVSLTYKI